ncbi:protein STRICTOSIDINE SYNTHASE-LIKE 6-like [Impatiens glandulifera]|uniref:protein STRICTOSIDINE SYNTHASE-LIKE 6-like n=1 Tax=Impatiens glandulifera TaxID=253017 RepID=UPI001FB1168B|nr:protein STRICTOSIDINE SYNTHASE-LIKE 6-like [Impatiens glandulifera]
MNWFSNIFIVWIVAPSLLAVIVYQLESFEPAHLPVNQFDRHSVFVPSRNPNVLRGAEKVFAGKLMGPEDMTYDSESRIIYTGCVDGWIKRLRLDDLSVEDWVNSAGRPLGLVLGPDKQLIVADADRGLLRVNQNGEMELLTNEAESLKFKMTNGVDVADDGVIYFTDASFKYGLKDFIWDMLEGRPNGRLLSYDPSTKQTKVLLNDLYYPNGVSLSHDQTFLVFCETQMSRCRKYVIEGEKKGTVEKFIEIGGIPDNIRYDKSEGVYWIGLASEVTFIWDLAQRYPFIRKISAIIQKYIGLPQMERNGGILAVDKDGKAVAHYFDSGLTLVTAGLKIGDHLYFCSLPRDHFLRLDVTRYPAVTAVA